MENYPEVNKRFASASRASLSHLRCLVPIPYSLARSPSPENGILLHPRRHAEKSNRNHTQRQNHAITTPLGAPRHFTRSHTYINSPAFSHLGSYRPEDVIGRAAQARGKGHLRGGQLCAGCSHRAFRD